MLMGPRLGPSDLRMNPDGHDDTRSAGDPLKAAAFVFYISPGLIAIGRCLVLIAPSNRHASYA
jgi:hypothetical protein